MKKTRSKTKQTKHTKTVTVICICAAIVIALAATIILLKYKNNDKNPPVTDTASTTDTTTISETTENSSEAQTEKQTEAETGNSDEENKADDKYVKETNYSDVQISDNGSSSEIELNYPVAQEQEYGDGANVFNEIIETKKDAIVNDFLRERELASSQGVSDFSYTSDYDVYNRTNGYLSVLLKVYITSDTEHPTYVYSSINFNTENSETIYMPPYCKCDIDSFNEIAKTLIGASITNDKDNYFPDVVNNYSDYYQNAKMVFDENRVIFIYEPGSIAPYAYGERVFEYSYSEFN